jgi:hypothetical protein
LVYNSFYSKCSKQLLQQQSAVLPPLQLSRLHDHLLNLVYASIAALLAAHLLYDVFTTAAAAAAAFAAPFYRRSRSSLHYDPYQNLLCVITGCKQLRIYPPAASMGLYPRPLGGEASNHSSVDFARPDLEQHPLYR